MAVWDVISVVLAIAAIVWFIRVIATGRRERSEEDSARAYFDRHGHWPDEAPAGEPPRS